MKAQCPICDTRFPVIDVLGQPTGRCTECGYIYHPHRLSEAMTERFEVTSRGHRPMTAPTFDCAMETGRRMCRPNEVFVIRRGRTLVKVVRMEAKDVVYRI